MLTKNKKARSKKGNKLFDPDEESQRNRNYRLKKKNFIKTFSLEENEDS